MLRDPLRVEPGEQWEAARTEAVRHVLRRQEILRAPKRVEPGLDFKARGVREVQRGVPAL